MLQIHDLLQEIDRKNVRRESLKKPRKQSSRLCYNQNVCHILEKNKIIGNIINFVHIQTQFFCNKRDYMTFLLTNSLIFIC